MPRRRSTAAVPKPSASPEGLRESARLARPALLAWFDHHKRDLPWRRTDDPYAIWVSEVMLQQTQVERVLTYYPRFLERFPTVTSLAQADLTEVLAVWRGLGYYGRARNLHLAAKAVVERFGGKLPSTLDELKSLPGFGRYTAGAVASIAFGLEAPLVDGNVARVLSRLLLIEGEPGDKAREAALWSAAADLVLGPRPGDLNQALMELGATVCQPSSPMCLLCPLQAGCGALASGRIDELPPPRKAAPKKTLDLAVAVAHRDGCVLLARRHEGGLFGGLWEMPCAPIETSGATTLRKMLGKRPVVGPEMVILQRTLTHRQLRLHLHPVDMTPTLRAPPPQYLEWRWVPFAETRTLGMSSAMESAMREAVPGLGD
ncbi:MAG: A/G-specific adenine glycosylase [Myxococcota bacterium]